MVVYLFIYYVVEIGVWDVVDCDRVEVVCARERRFVRGVYVG